MADQEHLTTQEVERYRQRALTPAARRRCDLHVAACDDCLRRLVQPEQSRLAVTQLREAFLPPGGDSFHLSRQELKNYASQRADEAARIICESHLDFCERCRKEMAALAAPGRVAAPGNWQRILAPRLAPAMAAVAVVLLVGIVWLPRIGTNREPELTGIERFTPPQQQLIQVALRSGQMAKPNAVAELVGPPIQLLGEHAKEGSLRLLRPLGTVVAEQQPMMRWEPVEGATSYIVSIYDQDFKPVADSGTLSVTAWQVTIPLQRGNTYSWQVTASRGSQQIAAPVAPAPQARFQVLDQSDAEELRATRKRAPRSHFALGVLYAGHGLLDDAEQELRAAMNENTKSPAARNLLQSVQSWRTR